MKKYSAVGFLALVSLTSAALTGCGTTWCNEADGTQRAGACTGATMTPTPSGDGGSNPMPPMGMTTYPDNDGDGYADINAQAIASNLCLTNGQRCSFFRQDCNDSNPAIHPGATEICNVVDDNCNGAVDEGLVCMTPGPNPTEICGNNRDDNGDGQIDEGCSSPMPTTDLLVRVVYDLPASAPAFTRFKIWNPYIHVTAPMTCEVTVNGRHAECSWRQGRLQPFAVQVELDLAMSITYHDMQSMIANPSQTRIWACTQGDWSTDFDDYGTTSVYLDGVLGGSVANGALSGAMVRVDNSRGPQPGSDGPRCHNGCNYSLANLLVPRNSCTN